MHWSFFSCNLQILQCFCTSARTAIAIHGKLDDYSYTVDFYNTYLMISLATYWSISFIITAELLYTVKDMQHTYYTKWCIIWQCRGVITPMIVWLTPHSVIYTPHFYTASNLRTLCTLDSVCLWLQWNYFAWPMSNCQPCFLHN